MDLGEDALRPEWLSTHYLNTVVEGHKHGGGRAFKSWIQTRTGGPVRVSSLPKQLGQVRRGAEEPPENHLDFVGTFAFQLGIG